jgi:hypothetical protein
MLTCRLYEKWYPAFEICIPKPDPYFTQKLRDRKEFIYLLSGLSFKLFKKDRIILFADSCAIFLYLPKHSILAPAFNPFGLGRPALPAEIIEKPTATRFIGPLQINYSAFADNLGLVQLDNVISSREEQISFEGCIIEVNCCQTNVNPAFDDERKLFRSSSSPRKKRPEMELVVREKEGPDTLRIYLEFFPEHLEEIKEWVCRGRIVRFLALYRRFNCYLEIYYKTFYNKKHIILLGIEEGILGQTKRFYEQLCTTSLSSIVGGRLIRNLTKVH